MTAAGSALVCLPVPEEQPWRTAQEPAFRRILVVCTGNLCRSPMAQAMLAHRFKDVPSMAVQSAGVAAPVGAHADPMAQALMRERGLDLSHHRARQLTPALVRKFELILVMEARQQRVVEWIDPSARGRVHRLGGFSGFDIPDPHRGSRANYEHALALIERGLDDLAQRM